MHPIFMQRFENSFNNSGAQLYTLRGNHFVFINSMAMESDGCEFCENTKTELQNIAGKYYIHTYIIGHYNPSVRIIDLVSHTTYVVCVNFIHKWRDLQFKVGSKRQIF